VRKLIAALGVVLAILLLSVLSGCGYDGNFRYPCQDPDNWASVECQPPICTASDTCTTDLIPEEDLSNGSDTTQP
jgi:hypothetical protein